MDEIRFVDTTLRDGHQSLWAEGMRTGMILPIAERMDKAGFEAIELVAPSFFQEGLPGIQRRHLAAHSPGAPAHQRNAAARYS